MDIEQKTNQESGNSDIPITRTNAPDKILNNAITLELKGPTTYLGEAWQIYKNRFWVFALILLLYIVIVFGQGLLVGSVAAITGIVGGVAGVGENNTVFLMIVTIVLVFLSALVSGIINYLLQGAMFFVVRDRQEKIGIMTSIKKSWQRLWPFFWVNVLVGLIVGGGTMILIIPGFILAIWFAFAPYIVLDQEEHGMNALLKSKAYVSGRWWSVFGRMMFLILIAIAIQLVLGIILLVVGLLLSSMTGVVSIVADVIQYVFYFLFIPIATIYNFLVYEDIKRVKGDFVFAPDPKEKKWYPIIAICLLVIPFLILIFAGYAIWYTVRNNVLPANDISSVIGTENNDNVGNTIGTGEKLTTENNQILSEDDKQLDSMANLTRNALDIYFTVKGYYPYTEKISNLWLEENPILVKEPVLPSQCGTLTQPGATCGIHYKWIGIDKYELTVDYLTD